MSTHKPPLPKKPGQVKVFRALYNFTAQREDQLSFEEGDLIYILDMISNKDWYTAKCKERIGIVPSNYIEESTETILNPMHEAAKRGNIVLLKECIENKVSVNSLDQASNTPLHWVIIPFKPFITNSQTLSWFDLSKKAAYGGHQECVQILFLSDNLIINLQNKLGDTPLHNAAYKKHDEICNILIQRGARINILNNDKKAPYDLTIDPRCKALLDYKCGKNVLLAENSEYIDDVDDGNDSD